MLRGLRGDLKFYRYIKRDLGPHNHSFAWFHCVELAQLKNSLWLMRFHFRNYHLDGNLTINFLFKDISESVDRNV